MLILAGLLAFALLDRLTGQWTVMDTAWMQDFAAPMITSSPLVWFLINLALAGLVAITAVKFLSLLVFAAQGDTTIRIRIMQKIVLVRGRRGALAQPHSVDPLRHPPCLRAPPPLSQDRFYAFLATRLTASEERGYDDGNTIVIVSWENASSKRKHRQLQTRARAPPPAAPAPPPLRYSFMPSHPLAVLGGLSPRVTAEYDKATGFMHSVRIEYNRRQARLRIGAAPTAVDVKNAISDELVAAGIFVDRSFHFRDNGREGDMSGDAPPQAAAKAGPPQRHSGAARAAAAERGVSHAAVAMLSDG